MVVLLSSLDVKLLPANDVLSLLLLLLAARYVENAVSDSVLLSLVPVSNRRSPVR